MLNKFFIVNYIIHFKIRHKINKIKYNFSYEISLFITDFSSIYI